MKRPQMAPRPARAGYTLVEMLVSVALTLTMMALVVQIFGMVGRSVNDSRATLEMSGQLRSVASRLRSDLQSLTADLMPPARPEEGKGYFEYTEGPIGPAIPLDPNLPPADYPQYPAQNSDEKHPGTGNFVPDTTAADSDDILMFTVRSRDEPFVGRAFVKTVGTEASDGNPFAVQHSAQSPLAEVAWFVRGRTLYRRVLLILPNIDTDLRPTAPGIQPFPYTQFFYNETTAANTGYYGNYFETVQNTDNRSKGFYNNFDLSVRSNPATNEWIPNTLADLTKPENRFAHQPFISGGGVTTAFPFHPQIWFDNGVKKLNQGFFGLPTLRECSHFLWPVAQDLPVVTVTSDGTLPAGTHDVWRNPLPCTITDSNSSGNDVLDPETGTIDFRNSTPPPLNSPLPRRYMGPRIAEDVILDNVIGFDVKAWDPTAPLLQRAGQTVVLAPGDPGYPRLGSPYTSLQLTQILKGNNANWTVVGKGAYVDLNYTQDPGGFASAFSDPPALMSGLQGIGAGVYDTWSTHYEHDGVDQNGDGIIDGGTNGFDDAPQNGLVDDANEADTSPPYPVPLRGIQVKIRVFEPDSRQIREVTIIQDFLPK